MIICQSSGKSEPATFGTFASFIRQYRPAWTAQTSPQLSREAIEEFKAIYQEEFGEMLSDEVPEIALRLLRFFGILIQPDQTKIAE